MGDEEDGDGPEYGPQGRRGELLEVLGDVGCIALQLACCRGVDVLQAPAGNHGVVAGDEEAGEDAEQADESREQAAEGQPVGSQSALGQLGIVVEGGVGIDAAGVGSAVATNDELAEHAGNAQQEHAAQIDEDEGCAAVLARHVGESPYVA